MAELMKNEGEIHAYDLHPHKLGIIDEGAERLKLSIIKSEEKDAKTMECSPDFDLVFADVPCTGFGTFRKKPDIKWKREHSDIRKLAKYQRELIVNSIKLLKDGGVFLYSTCTVDPMENEENIAWVLENYPELTLDRAENYLPEHLCQDGFMKLLPHIHGTDGAFAARLVKKIAK